MVETYIANNDVGGPEEIWETCCNLLPPVMSSLLATFELRSNEKKVEIHVVFTFFVTLRILAWLLNLPRALCTTCSRALLGSGAGVTIGRSLAESFMQGQLINKSCNVEQGLNKKCVISYTVDSEAKDALDVRAILD